MARNAQDREDLLRDAKGLRPRIQLIVQFPDGEVELTAGFRGAALSLYFGQDPAFHFNDRGQLRRAYLADELIKAEHGRLLTMRRERSDAEVTLVSQPLGDSREQTLLADLRQRLQNLSAALEASRYRTIGEVPPDGDAVSRLRQWLDARANHISAAQTPRLGS